MSDNPDVVVIREPERIVVHAPPPLSASKAYTDEQVAEEAAARTAALAAEAAARTAALATKADAASVPTVAQMQAAIDALAATVSTDDEREAAVATLVAALATKADEVARSSWAMDSEEELFATSPYMQPVASGTFTPSKDRVRALVDLGAAVSGLAKTTVVLLIGDPDAVSINYGLPQLSQDKEYNVGGAPPPGTQVINLGALNPHSLAWPPIDYVLATPTSQINREVWIEGLTPGVEYRWEIALAVVGGASGVRLGAAAEAADVAVSKQPGADNRHRAILHCGASDAKVRVVSLRSTLGQLDDYLEAEVAVQGGSGRVAISPDGSKGVYTNQVNDNAGLCLIDLDSTGMDMTEHALPGTGDVANAADFHPDGRFVFVTCYGTSNVFPFDTQTKTWGTPVALSSPAWGCRVSPDGTKLAVACEAGLRLMDINPSTGALTNLVSVARGETQASAGVAWHPSGTEVWLSGTSHWAKPYVLASAGFDNARKLTGFTHTINAMAFQPDGKNLFLFRTTSPEVRQFVWHPDRAPTEYLSWPVPGAVPAGCCGPHGQIFAIGNNIDGGSSDDYLYGWWGNRTRIRPLGVGEELGIRFEGVEE